MPIFTTILGTAFCCSNKRTATVGPTDDDLVGITYEQVFSWGKSFDTLMSYATGQLVFERFLRTEFSDENLLFYWACEDMKAAATDAEVAEKSRIICLDFLSDTSPKQVSVNADVTEGVNKAMKNPTKEMFDDAIKEVWRTMARDSYRRFLVSEIYRSALNSFGVKEE